MTASLNITEKLQTLFGEGFVDFSGLDDDEARDLLRSIVLSRCLNPTEPSQTLILASKILEEKKSASGETKTGLEELSMDELRTKIRAIK